METIIPTQIERKRRLRAVVEIDGGELCVYPIADNDVDEKIILDGLRFIRKDSER